MESVVFKTFWSSKSFGDAMVFNSKIKSLNAYTNLLRPFCFTLGFASKGYHLPFTSILTANKVRLFSHSFFKRPIFKPLFKSVRFNPYFFGPISDWPCDTFKGHKVVSSSVSEIFRTCDPSAIFLRIISVVINTVKLMFWSGSHAHVFKKGIIRLSPSLAHFNASPPILVKTSIRGAMTATDHRFPNKIKWRVWALSHAMKPSTAVNPKQYVNFILRRI